MLWPFTKHSVAVGTLKLTLNKFTFPVAGDTLPLLIWQSD
jgi:hypothetical protein